ncbi:MAG: tetratricopeptide repeat protein [Acidobacteriota bacterium]
MAKFIRPVTLLVLLAPALLFPQGLARRVLVEVKDSSQQPVGGVKVTVSSSDQGALRKDYVTNKRGQSSFLLASEIKTAVFRLEKEGFQTHEESLAIAGLAKTRDEGRLAAFSLYRTGERTPGQQLAKNQNNQKAWARVDQGIELFNQGNFAAAIVEFTEAVKIDPEIPEAHQNLASAHYRAGSYAQAVEAAQKALALNPGSSQMVKLLAVAYSHLGQEDKALEYQERLKDFPDSEFSAEELYNLGVVEANKKNDAEAARYFEKSARAKPSFALVHYQLGLCYFRLGKNEGAKTELTAYLTLAPEGEGCETAKTILAGIK